MENQEKIKFETLVEAVAQSCRTLPQAVPHRTGRLPNRDEVVKIIEALRRLMFPGYFAEKTFAQETDIYHVGALMTEIHSCLSAQVARALKYESDVPEDTTSRALTQKAQAISLNLLEKIPEIREYLAGDIEAAFEGDPAATGFDEIVFSYPGFFAISVHRIAHELYKMKVPMIPRIMGEHAHSLTGIDIHPGATIGRQFFIDHGTGVVIGETTVIGDRVKIYQGVTLGAMSTRGGQSLRGVKRHPTLEDEVTVYSGTSIFGGATVIGRGATVGSNCHIIESIPPGTRVSIHPPELSFKGAPKPAK
jgi:serine O-acetyltransferase